ncbi:glycosyltransferase [Methylobacterium sp. A49B]
MNYSGQTVCLSMIVKNEAHVIRRCLDSVRPVIDHWVIVDTGSTDGTEDVIRAAMSDVPGDVLSRPWVDFATNRSEALVLARPHADYTLIIDADDELIIPPDFAMPQLDMPGYAVTILDSFTKYTRLQLVSNAFNWQYRGVLHEFLTCDEAGPLPVLPLAMRRGEDGARHLDRGTYRRDVDVLEKALATEQDPFLITRYTFYLAQSYRDIGDRRKALEYYLKRAELGFWHEEIYISLLSAAYLMDSLNEPASAVLDVYDRAIAICPERAEARHGASRYCREHRDYVKGLYYAEAGLPPRMPRDALFLQPWIYNYGLLDEYSVNAFCTGQYRACMNACLTILGHPETPAEHRPRISRLAEEALGKMVDPVWGADQSSYNVEFAPTWRL